MLTEGEMKIIVNFLDRNIPAAIRSSPYGFTIYLPKQIWYQFYNAGKNHLAMVENVFGQELSWYLNEKEIRVSDIRYRINMAAQYIWKVDYRTIISQAVNS